jgi:putative FmdB family regulatory protein
MPLYHYACPACEVLIEALRPMALADDAVECPHCAGRCVRVPTAASSPRRVAPTPAPVYGRVPRPHQHGCACCAPRPLRAPRGGQR